MLSLPKTSPSLPPILKWTCFEPSEIDPCLSPFHFNTLRIYRCRKSKHPPRGECERNPRLGRSSIVVFHPAIYGTESHPDSAKKIRELITQNPWKHRLDDMARPHIVKAKNPYQRWSPCTSSESWSLKTPLHVIPILYSQRSETRKCSSFLRLKTPRTPWQKDNHPLFFQQKLKNMGEKISNISFFSVPSLQKPPNRPRGLFTAMRAASSASEVNC